MRGSNEAEEELGTVGVGTSVGHGENASSGVSSIEVLIIELSAIDGFATSAIASGEISALSHEFRNDSVELRSLEVKRFALCAHTLLTGAEAAEVFAGLWDFVAEEINSDSLGSCTTNLNVEENLGGHIVTEIY